jgi:adenylate cyclase
MSHDPDQDYFADGVTEDLITALSHQWGMRVVSRSSVFALRGRSIDIRTAARELDATHVVEGSVRRAGDRVRVTAQLIEAETDEHLWAERFDRDLGDIFGVQDDLVAEISAHVRPHVERSEVRRREGTSPDELTVWDLVLRARQRIWTNSEDGVREAVNDA